MSGAPYTKEAQLARGDRRYRRKVAGSRAWLRIRADKGGACRICGTADNPPFNASEMHHVVPRSSPWFGDDVPENIVPLCRKCHMILEARGSIMVGRGHKTGARKMPIAAEFVVELTDAEYAYAIHRCGEAFFERCYGIRYSR